MAVVRLVISKLAQSFFDICRNGSRVTLRNWVISKFCEGRRTIQFRWMRELCVCECGAHKNCFKFYRSQPVPPAIGTHNRLYVDCMQFRLRQSTNDKYLLYSPQLLCQIRSPFHTYRIQPFRTEWIGILENENWRSRPNALLLTVVLLSCAKTPRIKHRNQPN